ncbi:MAG TPA: hypothetical protein VHM47_00215 [Actinomycetota bacterium]|nr:hypothetical protein [Actinomycetota bacterium]
MDQGGSTGFAGQEFGTAYTVGGARDITWLLSFARLGAAAMHAGIRNEEALAWTRANGWGAALSGAYTSATAAEAPNVLETLATVAAPSPATERSFFVREARRRRLVRFRVVIAWVGVVLLAMAGATLFAGRASGGNGDAVAGRRVRDDRIVRADRERGPRLSSARARAPRTRELVADAEPHLAVLLVAEALDQT